MKKIYIALASVAMSLMAAPAISADDSRRGPPPEAFEVCEGQSEGDTVSINTPQGDSVEATCQTMQGKLVAVPEGAPQGGPDQD